MYTAVYIYQGGHRVFSFFHKIKENKMTRLIYEYMDQNNSVYYIELPFSY